MRQSPSPDLASLMTKKLDGLSESKAMQLIGEIIDQGGDDSSLIALDHADALLDQFLARNVAARYACRAHYFRANIWSAKRHASSNWQAWCWRSEAIDGEILELRRALVHIGFEQLDPREQAQIYTNLGNILNHTGRFVEAIEYWDRALVAVPKFAMACGNRGVGLGHYAHALYDPGHHGMLIISAAESLSQACSSDAVVESPHYDVAFHQFAAHLNDIWERYDIPEMVNQVELLSHSMGRSKKEREYRKWCLRNRLFINPLNDIGPNPIAARDVMTLPTITVGFEEGPDIPAVIHYFNIIKQEFCAARYALYEGIASAGVHFSDRGVLLYNTLDYPAFGFAIERMKIAFRGAYAVFDKTAFLLNSYLNLGHNDRQVNFRNVWFSKGKGKVLHPALDGLANWPLRGVFWLSKDIFEDDFQEVTEPDARSLYELRNHLEHKFVSVHDPFLRSISPYFTESKKQGIFDLSVTDLIAKTLRQLKLARATITYLSLGIHAEERRRTHENGSDELSVPMLLDTWDDSWKRQD